MCMSALSNPECETWLIRMWNIRDSIVMGHDSFACETWLTCMSALSNPECETSLMRMWNIHDSVVCGTWLGCETWFRRMRDMSHLYVRHDSVVCGTWLMCMWDMTHFYVRRDSFVVEIWLIEWWRVISWTQCETCCIYTSRDSLICDMTHWMMTCHLVDSLCDMLYLDVTRLTHIWHDALNDGVSSRWFAVWHVVFIHATCHIWSQRDDTSSFNESRHICVSRVTYVTRRYSCMAPYVTCCIYTCNISRRESTRWHVIVQWVLSYMSEFCYICNATLLMYDSLCDMTHLFRIRVIPVRHDWDVCETWLIRYVRHDSFVCETWLIRD